MWDFHDSELANLIASADVLNKLIGLQGAT